MIQFLFPNCGVILCLIRHLPLEAHLAVLYNMEDPPCAWELVARPLALLGFQPCIVHIYQTTQDAAANNKSSPEPKVSRCMLLSRITYECFVMFHVAGEFPSAALRRYMSTYAQRLAESIHWSVAQLWISKQGRSAWPRLPLWWDRRCN